MPRIRPVQHEEATPAARAAHDEVVREHGLMTNLTNTLEIPDIGPAWMPVP